MQAATEGLVPDLIRSRLLDRFGEPRPPQKLPPVDELVRTILSQNTNDRNRDRAFQALRRRFRDWRDVAEAPVQELARVISPAGLGPTKSRRIHDLLVRVLEGGEAGLHDLCRLPPEEAYERLLAIKGVGPKTAACVLLFSCGLPAFPVDTHVYRVAGRLGLLPPKADRIKAHKVLGTLFPERHYLELHLNLVRLGREVCRASRPLCPECPLVDVCPAGRGSAR